MPVVVTLGIGVEGALVGAAGLLLLLVFSRSIVLQRIDIWLKSVVVVYVRVWVTQLLPLRKAEVHGELRARRKEGMSHRLGTGGLKLTAPYTPYARLHCLIWL